MSVADEGALVPGVVRAVARAASEAAAAGGGLAGAAAGTSAEPFEVVADPTELRGGRNWDPPTPAATTHRAPTIQGLPISFTASPPSPSNNSRPAPHGQSS